MGVSIRARHCWRANLCPVVNLVASISFQSAPAIAGGRILSAGGSEANTEVSIRARHCWRANQPATVIKPTRFMFQSAPAIAGGRIASRANLCWSTIFSSTSANVTME